MEIAARSHDSALEEQRRELWINVYSGAVGKTSLALEHADEAVRQFDERFGETARAVGTKGENTCE